MRISDWSSDVCSSDLLARLGLAGDRRRDGAVGADRDRGRAVGHGDAGHHLIAFGRDQQPFGRAREIARAREAELRSEEHTSELQSLMRISYAVFCLKKKKTNNSQSYKHKIN